MIGSNKTERMKPRRREIPDTYILERPVCPPHKWRGRKKRTRFKRNRVAAQIHAMMTA